MKVNKVTIITPTARWGGIDIWKSSLQRQSFKNFEAFLIDEKYGERKDDVEKFIGDDGRLHHIKPPRKDPGKFWNLSKSLNLGLSLASGDLVVLYQDYIYLPDGALQRFIDSYQMVGGLIAGVGHKGKWPNWAIELTGKLTIFTKTGIPDQITHEMDKPEHGTEAPTGQWFRDPRISKERSLRPCPPIEWEGNWSCFSMAVARKIGGFDEDFDAGWGYDNVNFAERAQMLGESCWLDELNEVVGFSHETLFHEKDFKHNAPNNEELWARKSQALKEGKEKPVIESSDLVGLASSA